MKNYSMLENLMYLYKKLLKHSGYKIFFNIFWTIITSVAVPFLTAALPGFVLTIITSNLEINKIIIYVLAYAILLLILNILMQHKQIRLMLNLLIYRINEGLNLYTKVIDTDYINVDTSEGKEKSEKALQAIYQSPHTGIQDYVQDFNTLMINILSLALYLSVVSTLNVWITIFLLSSSFISFRMISKNKKWYENNKDKWIKIEKKFSYLKSEAISLKNGKDIRLYKIQSWFVDLFNNLLALRASWYFKEQRRYYLADLLERFINLVKNVIVYGYLLYKVNNGLGIGMFTLYLSLIAGISTWTKGIVDTIGYLKINNIINNDYRSFLTMEEKNNYGEGLSMPIKKSHKIDFENVSFCYPGTDKLLFDNFNLTIQAGEKIALVGINGAGKTTLVKLLCGLYTPDSGRILLDGVDIKKYNIRDYYKQFTIVFQDVHTLALTIAENVACCDKKYIDYEKVEKCIELAGISEKVLSLPKGIHTNLLKELDEDGIVLSGGETQKLMLARALYKDSPVIILDEPTATLDPIAESEMYEKYNSLTNEKTSIFISHRLSSTRFCDRILFMRNGKILESGNHDELMNKNGEYANMYSIQATYYQKEVNYNAI